MKDILLDIRNEPLKYLKYFGILLLFFYYTYPQALDVFGSSFILPSAAVAFLLYTWNRFPFVEVYKLIIGFLGLLFICYFSSYINQLDDPFIMTYLRSQMAWFFTAYLIVYTMFAVHKNPSANTLVAYMAGAVVLQCIITFAMNQNEWANEFFYSLQMKNIYTEEIKEMTEEQRLIGYGTAFFGAGMVAGYGLILLAYLISKVKMNITQMVLFAGIFAFVFYIGLFSARTTTIGLAIAIGFLFLLYFIDGTSDKRQPLQFVWITILVFFVGASLATYYFPNYTEWAFELFDTFKRTGKFSTDSSNGLYVMFYLPNDFRTMMLGNGRMGFWGNDVGFTRLFFYIGIPGAIAYFGYQLLVVYLSRSKDISVNLLMLTIFAYSLVLNVKGLTDLNPFLYLFFFYFIFYKYYRFYPKLYIARQAALRKLKETR